MFHYSLIFLVLALAAGLFGFGVLAGGMAAAAKIGGLVFLLLFLFTAARDNSDSSWHS